MGMFSPIEYSYLPENGLEADILVEHDLDAYEMLRRDSPRFIRYDDRVRKDKHPSLYVMCVFGSNFKTQTPSPMRLNDYDNFTLRKLLYDSMETLGIPKDAIFWLSCDKVELVILHTPYEAIAVELLADFSYKLVDAVDYDVTVACSDVFHDMRMLFTAIRCATVYADYARFVELQLPRINMTAKESQYKRLMQQFPDYHRSNYERIIISAVLNNNLTHAELITNYFIISHLMDAIGHYSIIRSNVYYLVRLTMGLITESPRELADSDARFGQTKQRILTCTTLQEMIGIMRDYYAIVEEYVQPKHSGGSEQKKMGQIVAFIEENFKDPLISSVTVCDKFNIGASYLSRAFKEHMGVNLSTYIQVLRVQEAKHLLSSTSLTTDVISEKVGYAGGQTLLKVFKKIEGVTPSAYKKMVKYNAFVGKNNEGV